MSVQRYYCAHPGCRSLVQSADAGCRVHSGNISKKRKIQNLENENEKLKKEIEELKANRSVSLSTTNPHTIDDLAFLRSEIALIRRENFDIIARVSGD